MHTQNILIVLVAWILFICLLSLRKGMIDSFKIGHYERKLENNGIDISKVKDIGLLDILRS